jgi:cytochrome c-type biogenesis protein
MEHIHHPPRRDWNIFFSSVFFVLGFSLVFSVVGILLQTTLAHTSADAKIWLGRLGGLVVILFGLFLLDIVTPSFLQRDHKMAVTWRFRSHLATSFVFGAAFALGWTPCVTAALGAILALAATNASSAFVLLFAYTLGIGIPFLLVGLFVNEAKALIQKAGPWLLYFQYFFGVVLVLLGIYMFVGELGKIANFEFLTNILLSLNLGTSAGETIASLSIVNIFIAFLAGLGSFLSPCILPIVPGFLSYLASTATKDPTSQ